MKIEDLKTLLGKSEINEDEQEEPKHVQKAIDDTLKSTLDEVGKSVMLALFGVINQKTSVKDRRDAINFSRKFLDEAISERKKQLAAVEARIISVKSTLSHLKEQKDYEAMTEKRLELRACTNYTLKLQQALLKKFTKLRIDFELKLQPKVAMAAAAA